MSEAYVRVDESDPAVIRIALDRPRKRNALSTELMEQLTAAVTDAESDVRRRVLVLRGEGPAFCAGLDLHEASNPATTERSARALADLYKAIRLSPLVTIAAAHGAAFGGGVGLLAACDLVVASDDLRIGFPEVRRGLVAALVTALLYRQVPERVLREWIVTGITISAGEALRHGVVNRVVPPDRLTGEIDALAANVIQGAPLAIARTKSLFDSLSARPIAADIEYCLRYHLEARSDTEAAEGIAAFLDKREPRWGLRPTSPTIPLPPTSPPTPR